MYFYNESLIFSLHSLHKYNKLYLRTNKKVSIRYLATRRAILTAMGVSPFARKLPPQAVHYISEDYCIDLPPCAIIKNFIKRIFFLVQAA